MLKLDKLNRIYIPSEIMKNSNVDFRKPVFFYLTSHNTVFLANASHTYRYTANLGKAYLDNNNKLYIPQSVREMLHIKRDSNLLVYCYHQIFIHKRTLPKKHL